MGSAWFPAVAEWRGDLACKVIVVEQQEGLLVRLGIGARNADQTYHFCDRNRIIRIHKR